MARFERILDFFPVFYGSMERGKLLYEVVRRLSEPLDEADTHLFRIQRAHRLPVAEDTWDIIRLAEALNLNEYHFEDILILDEQDYGKKLEMMRDRVRQIARVHLEGLGTLGAVMEAAAIFLNAAIVPGRTGEPLIKQVDGEGFYHKAVIEFKHHAKAPGTKAPRERLYLYENPLQRKSIGMDERLPMQSWTIDNNNVQATGTRLVFEGVGDRTVMPGVFCEETGEGIIFNGIVPDGEKLVIDPSGGAVMGDRSVVRWLTYFKGGLFEYSDTERDGFVHEDGTLSAPYDGDAGNIPQGPSWIKRSVPTLPLGKSRWRFRVAEGVCDDALFDYSVYSANHYPIAVYEEEPGFDGFDECIFDCPPSANAGMSWEESVPCSFKLLLPEDSALKEITGRATKDEATESSAGINHLSRIAAVLPRFKAAGVAAFVDYTRGGWVLGESVLRSSDSSEAEGIEFHSTRLRKDKADYNVQLDNRSTNEPRTEVN